MLKFKKFLLSNKNMMGLAFSSIIILLAMFGVVKSFWSILAMIAYILGYLVGPNDKEIKFFHISGESFDDYIGFLQKLKDRVELSQKLPSEAKNIINNIHTTATELFVFLQAKNSANQFNEDMINLKSIFDSYLPKLINEYERLPIKYATEVKTSNGKMAKEMLIEQLSLLEQKTTEISYGMYEDDVTALKINGRFLKEKFDKKTLFDLEMEVNS